MVWKSSKCQNETFLVLCKMQKRRKIPKMTLYILYQLKCGSYNHFIGLHKKSASGLFLVALKKINWNTLFCANFVIFCTLSDVKSQGISKMDSKLFYLS